MGLPLPPAALERMRASLGLITRAELLALGCTDGAIHGWLRHGVLEKVQRGVYRVAGAYIPPRQELLAAVQRCGPGARAGPRASLALHAIEGSPEIPPIGIVIPAPRTMRRDSVDFEVTTMPVPPVDRTRVADVPAISVTRSLIEDAPHVDERTTRVRIDDARRRRLTSLPHLERRATDLRSRYGARLMLRILSAGTARLESEGERALMAFLEPLGLPLESGVTDVVPGRRLDIFYRPGMVDFEYDGRDHHVLPTDRDHDGLRDLEAADHSVLTLRITAGMMRDGPDETLARIKRICETRRQRLA